MYALKRKRPSFLDKDDFTQFRRSSVVTGDEDRDWFQEKLSHFIIFAQVASSNDKPASDDIHEVTLTAVDLIQSFNGPRDSKFAQFVSRVLLVHHSTMKLLSEHFKQRSQLNTFMVRNLFYVSRELFGAENVDTELNAAVALLDEQISMYISKFLPSFWYKATQAIVCGSNVDVEAPLEQRDRRAIKKAFKTFNEEFEKAKKKSQAFKFAIPELAATLQQESDRFLTPLYQEMYEKFRDVDFCTNRDKYVKKSVQEMRLELNSFFS